MRAPSTRRRFFAILSGLGLTSVPFGRALWAQAQQAQASRVTDAMVREASQLAGLTFGDTERQGMVASLNRILTRADDLHKTPPANDAPSPILFNPRVPGMPVSVPTRIHRLTTQPRQTRPATLDEVAFWPVAQLADLVRRRLVSSVELTELYLSLIHISEPTRPY